MYTVEAIKLFVPTIVSFGIGMIIAPILIRFLVKNKLWKKTNVKGEFLNEK